MFAASAVAFSPDDPLSGLRLGEHPEPVVPDGWVVVDVRATSVNHHDLWTLKGVGLSAERLPMILGCDAAGVDPDGNEVIVHGVITDGGYADETVDPGRTLLSEKHQGTFAERVAVPARNLIPKPASLTWARGRVPADRVADRLPDAVHALRAGAGADRAASRGPVAGVSTALIMLARQAGFRVWVTSRDEAKGARAVELGAHEAFASGARLPEKVDVVMETVGAATWSHSLRSLKPGGRVVIAGATSGSQPARGPVAGVLPAAVRGRVHDGDPRRAGAARGDVRGDRRASADRPRAPPGAARTRPCATWPPATCSARSS